MKQSTKFIIALSFTIIFAVIFLIYCFKLELVLAFLWGIPFGICIIITIIIKFSPNTKQLKNIISKTIPTENGNFNINTIAEKNSRKSNRTYFIPEDFVKLFKDNSDILTIWKVDNDWQVETTLTDEQEIANEIKKQIRTYLRTGNIYKLQEIGIFSESKTFQSDIKIGNGILKSKSNIRDVQIIDNYCVIDIETTGLSRTSDQIIEISALRVRDNKIVDTLTKLAKPTIPIPTTATQINGITNEMVKNAPPIKEILSAFVEFVGDDVVIGHNIAAFDLEFINIACNNELGKPFLNSYIDTYPLARQIFNNMPNYKLPTLCRELGISQSKHRAEADCISTKELYDKIKEHKLLENHI